MNLEEFIRNGGDDVNSVSDIPVLRWGYFRSDLLRIVGCEDPYFSELNGTLALRITDRVVKRVLDETGEFLRNSDGSYVVQDYPVPTGSACVLSQIPLRIPYKYDYVQGYGFVDASLNPEMRGFLYVIPKDHLWRVPCSGLALSKKKMDSYRSVRVDLARYGKVYLHVIPFKPNKTYRASLILRSDAKAEYNFQSEIISVLKFWQSLGILLKVEEVEYNLFEIETKEVCLGGTYFNEDF